jgi:hypothetical protein
MGLIPTAPIRAFKFILWAPLCILLRRAYCHTLPCTMPHTACSHCHTLHTAHCRTLPHCLIAVPCHRHCCTLRSALPQTAARTAVHCRTLLPHIAALPHTAALPESCTIHNINSHKFTSIHINSHKFIWIHVKLLYTYFDSNKFILIHINANKFI